MPIESLPTAESQVVLVVEDDAEAREALCVALELNRYVVHTATNGLEAVDRARALKPDIILMDVVMPVMDGIQAIRLLKKDQSTRYIPIVIVTIVDQKTDIIRGLEAGAVDYITKPYFLPELKARIDAVLTARKLYYECLHTKEQLAKLEGKYQSLIENACEGIVVIQNGRFKFSNPKASEMLGYPKEKLLGKTFEYIVHPADQERVHSYHADADATEKGPADFFLRIIKSDGKMRCLENRTVSIEWEGKPATLHFLNDITERVTAEWALRGSEEKYRGIVEDMPAMICRFLPDGTLTFVNREYCRYFAREDHDLIGKNFFQFVPKDEHEQVRNHFKSLSATAPVVTYEHKVHAPDGTIRWQRWTDRALLDQRGRVVEYQSIGNDITDRKLALAEKAELERQLQQAQKMEAIGTLAGGIAHDFNNLLQSVLGYAQILLCARSEDHPDCPRLRNIVSAAERGAQLVRQLLTFSRSMESDRRPLNLNQEVLTLSKLFKGTFPKMIKVELDLAENLATINADPAQVEQVLMNLAVNARDAMPEGGKLIIRTENVTPDEEFFRLHPEAVPCDYVSLTVTDTGHGMDEGTLARIFEPFFTTKEFGKGTGLGLAIVYGIVKSHKGFITCSSQTGEGTTFKVSLPQAEGQTRQEKPAKTDAPLKGGTETILIVDDEEMIRDLWLEMCGNSGYRVIAAADGESALELYRKEKDQIGLIVLDLIMPGMGGIRCLEELRRINPEVRILIASGHMDEGFVKQAMGLGAKGHISKPFDLSRTLKAVRDALDEA